MKVQVRLFARAKDVAGAEVVVLDLPDGACVADLRGRLAAQYPAMASLLQRSAVAVENEFTPDDFALPARAEVALLPPVSGG